MNMKLIILHSRYIEFESVYSLYRNLINSLNLDLRHSKTPVFGDHIPLPSPSHSNPNPSSFILPQPQSVLTSSNYPSEMAAQFLSQLTPQQLM